MNERKKENWNLLLDVFVFISIFMVAGILILNYTAKFQDINIEKINLVYYYMSYFIFVVFVLDLIRLKKDYKKWGDFFSNCWIDVLATIPFGLIGGRMFEITKIVRLNKMFRLIKVIKQTKTFSFIRRRLNYKF